jgi:hypothetical protein
MHVYLYLMPNLLNSRVKIKGPIKLTYLNLKSLILIIDMVQGLIIT